MGMLNEIYKQMQLTEEYLNVPLSLEMCLPMIYQHRIITIRVALLLWCDIKIIKKYKNNNNNHMKLMIQHIRQSISSYLYYPLIPKTKYKSFLKKILKIIRVLITNSITQIRNSGDSKECKLEYQRCLTYFRNNLHANSSSDQLNTLTKLYLKSCKINDMYPEIKMNPLLYQKASKNVRQWLYNQIIKSAPVIKPSVSNPDNVDIDNPGVYPIMDIDQWN